MEEQNNGGEVPRPIAIHRQKIKVIQERIEKRTQHKSNSSVACDACGNTSSVEFSRILHDGYGNSHIVCRECGLDLHEAGFASAPYRLVLEEEEGHLLDEIERLRGVEKLIAHLIETGKKSRWSED